MRVITVISAMVVLLCAERPGAAIYDASIESGYSSATIFRDSEQSQLSFGEARTQITLTNHPGNWRWRFTATHIVPHGSLALEDKGGLSGRLMNYRPSVETSVSLAAPDGTIRGYVSHRFRDHNNESAAGAWIQPHSIIGGGYELGRENLLPSQASLQLANEGFNLTNLAPLDYSQIEFHLTPLNHLIISSVNKNGDLDPSVADPNNDNRVGYVAAFDGLWRDGALRATYETGRGHRLSGEYRRIEADVRLQGYYNGGRFAHFGVVNCS